MLLESLEVPQLTAEPAPLPRVELPAFDPVKNPFHAKIGDEEWLYGAQNILESRVDQFINRDHSLRREIIPERLCEIMRDVIIGSSEVAYIESRYPTVQTTVLSPQLARQLAVCYTPPGETIVDELNLGEDSFFNKPEPIEFGAFPELGLEHEDTVFIPRTETSSLRKVIELQVLDEGITTGVDEEIGRRLKPLVIHSELSKLAILFTYTAAHAYLWGRLGAVEHTKVDSTRLVELDTPKFYRKFIPDKYIDENGRTVISEFPGALDGEVSALPWTRFLYS